MFKNYPDSRIRIHNPGSSDTGSALIWIFYYCNEQTLTYLRLAYNSDPKCFTLKPIKTLLDKETKKIGIIDAMTEQRSIFMIYSKTLQSKFGHFFTTLSL